MDDIDLMLWELRDSEPSQFRYLNSYFSDVRTYLDSTDEYAFTPAEAYDYLAETEDTTCSSRAIDSVFRALDHMEVIELDQPAMGDRTYNRYIRHEYDPSLGDEIEGALERLRDA